MESFFSTDGEFRAARIHGPTGPDEELDFPSTLDFLQRHGTDAGQGGTAAAEAAAVLARSAARRSPAGPAPQETPPAEESTTAGISTPEPPEVRQAWGTWPIVVVAVLVVCVVLFFVARIAGW
ncbi:DUF6480 family protein [Kitasatospora sp. NPDC005751]|uniref:DUF6480 family protein n=1 Tax=Kitasatospora sp. NPDC005751 TaxID=3157064 RepID=UPI0033E28B63